MADIGRIEEYTTRPEGQTFDRKSARIEPKALAKDMVAMANADGGEIVIGIEDDGKITGIDGLDEHINELVRVPIDLCVPSVDASVERLACVDGNGTKNHVLVFKVEQSASMHATTADEAFYRVGDKSKRLTFDDRLQITLAKGVQYYEDFPVARATVDDLDLEFVERHCRRIGYTKGALAYLRSNGDFVQVKHGTEQVSGAAVLLFGKTPQRFFQRAHIRFIRYEGTEEKFGREMNVIKDVTFTGKILDMTRTAIEFVRTQIKERTYLGPGALFVTEPEYPEFCWTELIVNAVAHRDYSILGTDIQIKMFDDHYLVESPGILPGKVRLNNMRTTHFSRNPKFAAFMKEYEFIREFGEGVDRMYRELEQGGWPEPTFRQDDFMLRASLTSSEKAQKNYPETTQEPPKNHPRTTQELPDSHPRISTLSSTASAIVTALRENPSLTRRDLAEITGKSEATVKEHLKNLQEAGIIKRIGPTKGGYWKI